MYNEQGQRNEDILTVYHEQGHEQGKRDMDILTVNPVQETRQGGYSNSVP